MMRNLKSRWKLIRIDEGNATPVLIKEQGKEINSPREIANMYLDHIERKKSESLKEATENDI